MPQLLFSGNKL